MNPLKQIWLKFAGTRVGQSIFRVGLPESNLGRMQAMVSSFLLHLHPAKVHRHSLQFSYTLGLGLISLYLFLILCITGVALMFFYVPHPDHAYDNMKDIEFVVSAGMIARNMHRWSAHLMVLCVFLHMCRVFYTGGYKPPREFNWTVGVGLFVLTLALSFTGYLLPWDQLAFWAITVGTNIAGYAPVIGKKIQFVLLGGNIVGESALLRFYVLHVILLPAVAVFLIALHLWRVRKDGGLSRPGEPDVLAPWSSGVQGGAGPEQYYPTGRVQQSETGQLSTSKTYGLMELARGTSPAVGLKPEEELPAWPHLVFRELLLFLATMVVVMFLSVFWNAPLEGLANPTHPPNPAKAPWYFLGLQELTAYSAFWGGVAVPALLLVALVALPYLDRKRAGVGVWFARERRVAVTIFTICVVATVVLTVIGTYFRGPNWGWVWPWAASAVTPH